MTALRFRTAGSRVDLFCEDAALAELVRRVGAPMLAPEHDSPADVVLEAADVPIPAGATVEQRAARVLSAVDRAALAASSALPIHAAAVAGPRGCVVLPGESGRGKTTLAAAAMQLHLVLLSDEAACLTEPVGTVLPHPRPLGLSLHSRNLLGITEPGEPADELACAPDLFGASASTDDRSTCVSIVLPCRSPGAEPALEEIGRSNALAALLASRLDGSHGAEPWSDKRAWRYLTELVDSVPVARLRYDRPQDGAQVLASLVV